MTDWQTVRQKGRQREKATYKGQASAPPKNSRARYHYYIAQYSGLPLIMKKPGMNKEKDRTLPPLITTVRMKISKTTVLKSHQSDRKYLRRKFFSQT